jgi:hypothetical protein
MPYIKKQNICYNDDHTRIISGSAAIAASVYDVFRKHKIQNPQTGIPIIANANSQKRKLCFRFSQTGIPVFRKIVLPIPAKELEIRHWLFRGSAS